jgi:TatD DNase family protein
MESRLCPMDKAKPRFVDYHCHLDLYPNHAEQFVRCDAQQVATLAVTTTPRAWPRNRELAQGSAFIRVGLGIHPQLVNGLSNELSLFEQYLPDARFVGEVGLDASPQYFRNFSAQKEVFQRILRACAEAGEKILSVHSVRATGEVLRMIAAELPPDRGRIVLHWFGGTKADAERAVKLGCYFSVNAEMLKSDKRRAVVAALPVGRLLTETDGPFTGLQPGDASDCIQTLARIFGTEEEVIKAQVLENLSTLEAFSASNHY